MKHFLPRVIATITGKPRQLVQAGVDFQWSSKSWTHNVFRVYELIFGRREGIRLESASGVDQNGVSWVVIHTFEAAVAHTETLIRNAFALPKFKFVKLYLPQLAPVGFAPMSMPYLLAIAFDVTANGTNGASSSVTYSHTCTGSNLTLTVQGCQNGIPLATTSSATYNSVSVPGIVTDSNSAQNTWMDIRALASPATGANSVVWTANQSPVSAFSFSLTGTAASPVGASGHNDFSAQTTASQAITTTAANSWLVDNLQENAVPTATGTGQTRQAQFIGVGGNKFAGSTTTTTTVGGPYTVSYSWTGNQDGTILVAEIKAGASGAALPFKALLGVGL